MTTPPSSMLQDRFTLDGSDELEEMLAQTCSDVVQQVRRAIPERLLHGIALGGGYGRGEGGVRALDGKDLPYNDMEFYVFLRMGSRGDCQKYGQLLETIGHSLAQGAGIEIEFKVLTLSQFGRSRPSMFYFDLVRGHKVIWGDLSHWFATSHHNEETLPLSEASRLLLNRCSGLLLSLARLREFKSPAEDADFIERNVAKLQLALGDAVLVYYGSYHGSARARHERLQCRLVDGEVPKAGEVLRSHELGLAFKLHPRQSTESREELAFHFTEAADLAETVWLWLENQRLGSEFQASLDYALSGSNKCPEQAPLRNVAVNAKEFGLRGLLGRPWRYPRNRLYDALPILLWNTRHLSESSICAHLKSQLLTEDCSFSNLIKRYTRLWERFR